MISAPFHLAGERLALDPAGTLFWPAQRLLAVADLHLEKGSHFAARGQMVPPFDTRDTLSRLQPLLRRYTPQHIVFLGDSFHDSGGSARMQLADRALLAELLTGRRVTWVLGNHDPAPPVGLPGEAVETLRLGPLVFRHQGIPDAASGFELSGHFHPKASMPTRCGPVTRPCFLADARRILLPAFGSYTGGLEITAPPVAALFPRGGRAFLLGRERLFSFAVGPMRHLALAARPVATTSIG
ncbi:ligase-associated DNA damage response endonuclease PdeM [Pseudoroseomonas globiformis]|uniref:Ligase-associated DNA damage response endonuclease PdeM n=1 Tax=Teichococcus globiformis TaxID=2307229 RepID=A0ABV7G3K2_9PROT